MGAEKEQTCLKLVAIKILSKAIFAFSEAKSQKWSFFCVTNLEAVKKFRSKQGV
jgi:hypothetical protein